METIRKVATALVTTHGLDHVTTEMIAEEAGISLRTFFNYFTYKEEALIPPSLGFPPKAVAAFVSGKGLIPEDLVLLLEERLAEMELERKNIRVIMGLSDAHPRLQSVREHIFRQYEAEFRALLGQRLGLAPDHHRPTLMAAVISTSFRVAMCRWIEGDSHSMIAALRTTLATLPTLFDET
ncbi:MAG: TetR family transcriptional regulator [Amylibacter sp.]|nr:TetR family transcriptional regulator [Amylibacter sp.]